MPRVNEVRFGGHIGRDPSIRTNGPTSVCSVSLAISRGTQAKPKPPIWVELSFWGTDAECAYDTLAKGDGIVVEGRLDVDEYEKDGQTRTSLRCIVSKVVECTTPKGGKHEIRETRTTLPPKQPGVEYYPEPDTDSIPFAWALLFIMPALWSAINGTWVV